MAIGFDLVTNQDFPCSGRFSGDSICDDFVTHGQFAPDPRTVCWYCSCHEQRVFFWMSFAALNAEQSGPTHGQSGAAAEACPELFQQVFFCV